jgi:signal transduction histidine kinase
MYIPLIVFLFRGQVYQKIFALSMNYVTVSFFASLTLEIVRHIAPVDSLKHIVISAIIYSLMFASYNILLFLFWRKIFNYIFIEGKAQEWTLYMASILFSSVAVTLLRVTLGTGIVFFFLLLFVIWNFFILCFAIINTHEKTKKSYETEFAQNIISAGSTHYRKLNEMYDTLSTLRHDYKYHLNTIGELANKGDNAEIVRYLSNVQAQLPRDDLQNYSKNSVINALLASYADRCAKLNIRFDVRLAMPKTLSITDYDMCIILGNLIENAVEACQKLDESGKIELEVKTQGKLLAVMISNNFSGEIAVENNQPVSTKKNGGFGLRSIRTIAARYDGQTLTEWNAGTFTAYVMLKI